MFTQKCFIRKNTPELRKKLMQKVIPAYEGEVWCISKHLLSSSMRLMEVGTKQLSLGNKKEAYELFDESYNLYCMFWGLNMNMINVDDVKWIEDSKEDIKNIRDKIEIIDDKDIKVEKKEEEGAISKMKNFVKKAVNCCIE